MMRFGSSLTPPPRFEILHVPVPEGGFCVRDNYAMPVRFHAGGRLYTGRKAPTSSYYETRAEAEHVAAWLTDRHAGYPYNLLMAEWPVMSDQDRRQRWLDDRLEDANFIAIYGAKPYG